MASKKELFESVVAAVSNFCANNNVKGDVKDGLIAIINDTLAPKAGGVSVDLESVVKRDIDGNITHILCSVSNKFLPATADFFYEDKEGKGINGLKRLSRQAEGVRKRFIKELAATERAIMQDVLGGVMSPEAGKAKLDEARAAKPDYAVVSDVIAEEVAE